MQFKTPSPTLQTPEQRKKRAAILATVEYAIIKLCAHVSERYTELMKLDKVSNPGAAGVDVNDVAESPFSIIGRLFAILGKEMHPYAMGGLAALRTDLALTKAVGLQEDLYLLLLMPVYYMDEPLSRKESLTAVQERTDANLYKLKKSREARQKKDDTEETHRIHAKLDAQFGDHDDPGRSKRREKHAASKREAPLTFTTEELGGILESRWSLGLIRRSKEIRLLLTGATGVVFRAGLHPTPAFGHSTWDEKGKAGPSAQTRRWETLLQPVSFRGFVYVI